MRAWRGEAISQAAVIWVGGGLVMAASWGVVTVINKRLLADVHPVPLNFLVRVVAIGGLVALTVPLAALRLWPYGFGINGATFWYVAASACVTWLVAFSAYYYALAPGASASVFGIAAGMLLLKERLSARLALAVAITMTGVLIATAARLF